MNTAKEFAAAAVSISQMADRMKPTDADAFCQTRKLIQYHLLCAAKHTREIAEAIAKQEPTA